MLMKDENIWNIPNILTMLRMALIGVFIFFFVTDRLYFALFTFLLACITDYLDGYIARKHQLITTFGKLMDPIADKLMLMTALVCLMAVERVPVWVVPVVIAKEITMMVGGYLMFKRGIVVYAHMIGKMATALFGIAVVAAFFGEYIAPFSDLLMFAAVILMVVAFLWYLVQALRKVNDQGNAVDENNKNK